ncbi:MAG TPA: glycosyltransferase family 39 protein [Eoetvoesiella sp.]
MSRRINLWWVLCAILCLPLLSMALFPLADTSEPRYAEIARVMAQSGDWITPWFEPGIPFWGKPPLSFWAQALSFKLFGVTEFAARLPSWLATLATIALIIGYARVNFSERVAKLAAIIYGSSTLVYMASAAVLTDPFLTLGTTLAMTGLVMAEKKPTIFWRYSFFIGLAIGLLAKGPLALVLVGGATAPWVCLHKSARTTLKALPWGRGLLLTAILSVPWYIAAELKTPGFLDYFIVGEHFLRFIDSGWKGDLYGTPHTRVHGTIWYYWIQASFPWGLIAIGMVLHAMVGPGRRTALSSALRKPEFCYLTAWALFTPVFFTLAGNILWTYLLPALAPFSILLAIALQKRMEGNESFARKALWPAGLAPIAATLVTLAVAIQPGLLKTEQGLVYYAKNNMQGQERLLFVDKRPFSARFYSRGTAGLIAPSQIPALLAGSAGFYLAVPIDLVDHVIKELPNPIRKKYEDRRYVLLFVPPQHRLATASDVLPPSSAEHVVQ